ncbi:MAG: SCP2 sterol-binding domain-containing protein [Caldilineaceae bacterium]|uniref:SCP2 sterol-binding domain-containing protein n=1 Tax=Caldilinea sp. TaxID=2293560 RepID=UPI0019F2EC88|nr:SCP2 sterol-binding domain-containing protein [Caldilineaceae bacterium]MBK8794973.1 SCP2 sterol-binding domain-containing protein [Anaerolineales bacterium]HQY91282.1 SCP2 sterol-binding domain-containing protein [Caldilinea sp.]HRA65246.1 SCP2 sterol-binding domain-containing protein [Caldilinea sp.]
MSYKFPSPEWVESFYEQINGSDAYANAAKTWEGDITLVIEGSAGIYLDLWHGKCRAAEFMADPDAKSPEFKITADMEKWKKVLAGKLDPVQGMVTRQIKLDGNLVKIMKNVKAAQELVRCATRVPTVYE